MTCIALVININNQSLSRILNFKPLFVTILLCFTLFSVQLPRNVCVANRNIGQICLNIFYLFYQFYFSSIPPSGSVCRLYFILTILCLTNCSEECHKIDKTDKNFIFSIISKNHTLNSRPQTISRIYINRHKLCI